MGPLHSHTTVFRYVSHKRLSLSLSHVHSLRDVFFLSLPSNSPFLFSWAILHDGQWGHARLCSPRSSSYSFFLGTDASTTGIQILAGMSRNGFTLPIKQGRPWSRKLEIVGGVTRHSHPSAMPGEDLQSISTYETQYREKRGWLASLTLHWLFQSVPKLTAQSTFPFVALRPGLFCERMGRWFSLSISPCMKEMRLPGKG